MRCIFFLQLWWNCVHMHLHHENPHCIGRHVWKKNGLSEFWPITYSNSLVEYVLLLYNTISYTSFMIWSCSIRPLNPHCCCIDLGNENTSESTWKRLCSICTFYCNPFCTHSWWCEGLFLVRVLGRFQQDINDHLLTASPNLLQTVCHYPATAAQYGMPCKHGT